MRRLASNVRCCILLWLFLLDSVTQGWLLPRSHSKNLLPFYDSLLSFRKHQSVQITQQNAKFAQPAFQQPSHRRNKNKTRQPKFGGDSKIAELHSRRVKTAGRVGTKRFVNPCKVFLGNLPLTTTESELETWICTKLGLPPAIILNECKIIRDWKTSKSKGYGFAVFTEAIYATVCIDKCHGQMLGGRKLTVKQGRKKQKTEIYVKKTKKPAIDAEEAAIQQGMAQAEQPINTMDPSEVALLRSLDPDLVDDAMLDSVEGGNDILFVEDDEDDNEGVDGVFVDNDDTGKILPEDKPNMNRQQRREEARRQKRKKTGKKGFGS